MNKKQQKVTWTEYQIIRRIKNTFGNKFSEYPDNKKDFYNSITGMVICGNCNKTMRPLQALFHWHVK